MNKASGGDGIPAELFQILKDDAVKVPHSISQQIWKTAVATGWKRSVFIPIPKKGNAKESSDYRTVALVSHASTEKAMAPTPVLLRGKSHGQRSLVGYSPWGHKELEVLSSVTCLSLSDLTSFSMNPMDGGAWGR